MGQSVVGMVEVNQLNGKWEKVSVVEKCVHAHSFGERIGKLHKYNVHEKERKESIHSSYCRIVDQLGLTLR